jgi:hypothetical protein
MASRRGSSASRRPLTLPPVEKPDKKDSGPDSQDVKKAADGAADGNNPEGDGCYAYQSGHRDNNHLPRLFSNFVFGQDENLTRGFDPNPDSSWSVSSYRSRRC